MKAIITDLDRTLLMTDKSVSEKTISVLKEAREKGIKVMFATARPRRAITHYEELLHPDAVTTLNGARTFINDSFIDYSIPYDSVRKMLSGFLKIPGCVISMETSKGIYANVDIPEWAPVVTDCFPEIPDGCGSVFKILVSNENVNLNEYINSIVTDDSYFTVAVGTLFQIMSRTATKLNGVKAMLEVFGIDSEDAVYFGDDNDDIEPLKWCGKGVAVKNAIPEAASAADEITVSNDEDGVALWIEKKMKKKDWTKDIPEGSFISKATTYKVGEYFHLFKKDAACGMNYYFFDPTENGFEKGKSYPVLIFLHGYTNALEGDVCINYAGAEFFATEKYQKALGGAYILVPLANEKRNADGEVVDSWSEDYQIPLYNLIRDFIKIHADAKGGVSKKLLWGNSAGAYMTFCMAEKYPDFFNALIPVGSDDIPSDSVIDKWDENNVHLFFAMGKRDEFNDYEGTVVPRIPRLKKMKDCFIFTPDWVYNGDKGIASINFGTEMGQHCLVNPMHCNLMFDDGTCMDNRLPRGLTDWINYALKDHPYIEKTPVLETERLILRPIKFTDLEAIFKWTGDEKTSKYMLYPRYNSTADGVDWVNSLYTNADDLDYGFVWKETGELIGSGGIYHSHHPETEAWSIGYNIRSDMWGKGITTEAMKKIIEYARSTTRNIKEIAGTFATDNIGSRRVMEKLGMTFLEETEYTKFDGSATFKAQTFHRRFE